MLDLAAVALGTLHLLVVIVLSERLLVREPMTTLRAFVFVGWHPRAPVVLPRFIVPFGLDRVGIHGLERKVFTSPP